MNAVQDMIMQMLTVQKTPYSPAASAKRSDDESASFGDLLTEKHAQANDTVTSEGTETTMQPTESVPAEEQELTSEQMELLAAMNASTKTIFIVPAENAQPQHAVQQSVQLDVTAMSTAAVPADTHQSAVQQPTQNAPVVEVAAPAAQEVLAAAPAAQETLVQSVKIAPQQQNELGANRETNVHSDSAAAQQRSTPVSEIAYTASVVEAKPAQSDAKPDTMHKFDLPVITEQTTETAQEGETVLTTAQRLFTVVEAAPVKVADAPVVDTTAPTMEADLSRLVTDAAQAGEESITIRLAPETLGEIEVRLTRGADGALQVVMTTANERTQSILEKHAAGLQTMLGANTRGEVEIEVTSRQQASEHSFERDAQHHGGQEQEQKQQHQQQKRSSEDFLQQLRLGLLSLDAQAI